LGGLGGNILVHTNCMDITMAWKTSCKDVATRVGSFALHIIFCFGLRGNCPPPCLPSNDAPDCGLYYRPTSHVLYLCDTHYVNQWHWLLDEVCQSPVACVHI